MLLKEPEINIYSYKITDEEVVLQGEINDASSVSYTKRFTGYGTLEMYVPMSSYNLDMCNVGNMLMMGSTGRYCYIITGLEPQKDDAGFVKIKVSGRGLEQVLYYRMLYNTYKFTDTPVSDIMYTMVERNFIISQEGYARRVLPHVRLHPDAYVVDHGPTVTIQRTGKSVKDRLDDLCEEYNLGYELNFNPSTLKFVFRVLEYTDKTYGSGAELPIIFDTDTDDVLESTYTYSEEDYRNMGLVVGESQDSTEQQVKIRAKVVVGDDTSAGWQRREIYIDARDLQSESENDSGTIDQMSDAEYEELLKERGAKKLAENAIVQSFETNIRYYGSQYEFDVDYTIGDKVTIIDKDMGVVVDAYVTQVEHVYSNSYEMRLTIGTDVPTIYSKVRRMMQD